MQRYEIIFKVMQGMRIFLEGITVWNMESAEAERLELMRSLRDEGKSYREIADIVDCSVSTVHKYLAKLN